MIRFALSPLTAALLIAVATIAGAWGFELIGGLVPCKLCLQQRIPYYVGIPLILAALAARGMFLRLSAFLAVLAASIFLVGAGLGAYQAGAEWGFWVGPNDCGGGTAPVVSAADLFNQMNATRFVSCTEASWRMFGLSFAGWNMVLSAVVSLLLAVFAAKALRAPGISSMLTPQE